MKKKTLFAFILLSLAITMVAGCGVSGGGSDQTTSGGGQTVGTGHVSLAWDAPTTYVDGTPIAGPIGFKVYYGTASGAYTHVVDVQGATSWSISTLTNGTWYFDVTCYDSNGSESDFSNEISTTI